MRISAPFQHFNMSQSHSHMLCITYSWLTVYKELYSVEKSVHLHYACKVALLPLNGNVNNQNNLYWYPLHEIALYDLKVRDQCAMNMHKSMWPRLLEETINSHPLLCPSESGNILQRINWTRKIKFLHASQFRGPQDKLLNGCPKRDTGQMFDNSCPVAFQISRFEYIQLLFVGDTKR